ncbi:histidine kinase, partial [Flavobacteriaceae bacterium]|nr:histidine kinase [Flavobacteriaceae bacterium]
MNPHFIFNALNGVQSVMILQGEQMANKYLGIFSKLLRFTIEMTNTEMISLEDELSYLSAYIELQKMRMQSAIVYNVVLDQEIDISNCFLPTMLLQPLIEKAIIHGITPLKTKGVIDLVVRKNEQVLILSVNDNGVGRKESARLKNFRKDGVHKSFANQIMKERIDIFNYLEKSKTDFRMEEFDDKNSEDFERISKEIKCLWVIKISSIKTNKRKKSNSFYYKKISRPLVQQDFESLLFQILQFKLDHRKRQLSEQTEFYLIPESDTSHRVPILKVDSIISIRKTNYGI